MKCPSHHHLLSLVLEHLLPQLILHLVHLVSGLQHHGVMEGQPAHAGVDVHVLILVENTRHNRNLTCKLP